MADTTPDIRLSPDKKEVAIRTEETIAAHPEYPWRSTSGLWFSNREVTDWTLLAVLAAWETLLREQGTARAALEAVTSPQGAQS